MKKHSKVLILGSGPAGYTAAIYAARAMLKPILVFGSEPGGQLTTTTDVENFPGYSKVIQGPWLMEEMKGQAKAVGTEMIQDHISKVDLSKKPFTATGNAEIDGFPWSIGNNIGGTSVEGAGYFSYWASMGYNRPGFILRGTESTTKAIVSYNRADGYSTLDVATQAEFTDSTSIRFQFEFAI